MAAPKTSKIVTDAEPRNILYLPLELLFCIARHLPASSIACLAVCNRSMYDILAYDYLPLLHRYRGARFRFFTALEKDPRYYICHRCIKLHTCISVRKPGTRPSEQPLACVRTATKLLLHENSTYALQYVHVQLAMERHRHGLGIGIPLDTFEHTEVEINRGRGTATLISTEARIASNKLLLRTQTCILGSPKPKTVSNKIHALSLCSRIGITLCNGPPMDGPMDNRFVKAKCSFYDMSWECWDCLSDYRIDFLDFGELGTAIVATRWFDLGSGMKPSDAQPLLYLAARQKLNPMYCSTADWGRIKFEALHGPSIDEATAKNATRLILLPTALLSRLDRKSENTSDAKLALPGPLKARGCDGTEWECREGNSDWWYLLSPRDQIAPPSLFELINGYGTPDP